MVSNIKIGKLPYQKDFYISGVQDGHDVWLKQDGTWTREETSPECVILGCPYLVAACDMFKAAEYPDMPVYTK